MHRRRHPSLGQWLLKSPWYVSVVLGILAFIALRWAIPAALMHNPSLQPYAVALPRLSPIPLILFGLFAFASTLFEVKRQRLADEQSSLEKLRETGWDESLLAEAFRRQGHTVERPREAGSGGGADLVLRKDGRTTLVHCSQWKAFSIGAPVIRELTGLMTAGGADEGIIVTTGKFTLDARETAAGKPIRLIDGPKLLALVRSVPKGGTAGGSGAGPARRGGA